MTAARAPRLHDLVRNALDHVLAADQIDRAYTAMVLTRMLQSMEWAADPPTAPGSLDLDWLVRDITGDPAAAAAGTAVTHAPLR